MEQPKIEDEVKDPGVKRAEEILEDMKKIDEHAQKAEERLGAIQKKHSESENKS